MTVTVQYTCPRCDTVVSVERRPALADRSVTKRPQPGWKYATPDEEPRESADGIAFCCGEDGPVTDLEGNTIEGCGDRSLSISSETNGASNSSRIRRHTAGLASISTAEMAVRAQ